LSSEFTEQLFAAARNRDMASNPFILGIRNGVYPRARVAAYAADIAAMASEFPQILATLLARCIDAEVRPSLLENLLEEEGVQSFRSGESLVVDPRRRHSELAWHFARAAGSSAVDTSRSAVRSAWLDRELRDGRWIGPLAYVTIGLEANIPPTFRPLLEGLRDQYGFEDADLAFYTEHLTADERHSAKGAAVVAAAARTPDAQREALEGARRGAAAWWHFHRRHDQALRSSLQVETL
jgi:pyrroloquinoline quinone (PQQ) biosynthesis protein C